jgi:ElaB/YqjD/DUF883 family membrane-anchored ribosome-binding protein
MIMATAKDPSTDDIRAHLDTIREDVGALAKAVKALADDRANTLKETAAERAEAAKRAGLKAAKDGQHLVEEQYEMTLAKMRENPATTLAVVAGVGFLVGLLLSPRR